VLFYIRTLILSNSILIFIHLYCVTFVSILTCHTPPISETLPNNYIATQWPVPQETCNYLGSTLEMGVISVGVIRAVVLGGVAAASSDCDEFNECSCADGFNAGVVAAV
jgi:hypothetical protein